MYRCGIAWRIQDQGFSKALLVEHGLPADFDEVLAGTVVALEEAGAGKATTKIERSPQTEEETEPTAAVAAAPALATASHALVEAEPAAVEPRVNGASGVVIA